MPLPQEKAALAHIAAHSRLPEAWLRYLAAFPRTESNPLSPPWDDGPGAWSADAQRSEHCVSAHAIPVSHHAAQSHVRQQAALPLEQSIAAAEDRASSAPTSTYMGAASAPAPTAPYEMPLAPFFVPLSPTARQHAAHAAAAPAPATPAVATTNNIDLAPVGSAAVTPVAAPLAVPRLTSRPPATPAPVVAPASASAQVAAPVSTQKTAAEISSEQAQLHAIAEHSQLPVEQLQQLSAFPRPPDDPLSPPWDDAPQQQPAPPVKPAARRAAYVPVRARSTGRMTPLEATLQVQAAVEALQTGVVSRTHDAYDSKASAEDSFSSSSSSSSSAVGYDAAPVAPYGAASTSHISTAANTGTTRRSTSTLRSRKDHASNVVVTETGERLVVSPLKKRNQQVELVSAAEAQQIVSYGKVTPEGLVRAGKAKIISLLERVKTCVQPDFVISKQEHLRYQEQFTVSNNRGLELKIGVYYNKNKLITSVRANHQYQAFAPYLQRLCAELIGSPLDLAVSTTRGRKRR